MKSLPDKIIYILFLCILITFSCDTKSSSTLSMNSVYTNETDQEFILLSQEYEKHNYERIIDFVNSYFKKNKFKEENAKLLNLKSEAKEKLVLKYNKRLSKNTYKKAKKYNFKIKNSKIIYQYEELKKIWEKLPKTTYGKDAFFKYIKKVNDPDKKTKAYEIYIDEINDKNIKNNSMYELSKLYVKNIFDFNTKISKKLSKLYKKLINTEYKDKILFNSLILQYKITGDNIQYKKDLKLYFKKKNINGFLSNYLLGESEFIDNNLKEAKDYLTDAQKMYKHIKEKEDMPILIAQLEQYSELSIKHMKNSIKDKLKLIKRLLEYKKSLLNKKIAFVTGERVRVRKDPSLAKKNIMTTLNYGDKVTIIKKSDKKIQIENQENYWYNIQLIDNTTGWVFGKYLLFFIY